MREQVGVYDVKWQEKYGMVARIKAPLGVHTSFLPIKLSHSSFGDYTERQIMDLRSQSNPIHFTNRALQFCEAIRRSIRP